MNERPKCCGKSMWSKGKSQSGNRRWICSICETRTTNNKGDTSKGYDETVSSARVKYLKQQIKKGQNKFVITAAQNNTSVNHKFFDSLLTYCELEGAELIVIPIHYKNISLYTANQEYKKSWDKSLTPYIVDKKLDIGGNVLLQADISLGATMFNPLVGKESIGGGKWTIFGHPQFAMAPVANPGAKMPKRMYTTGVCTRKNYSRTNIGAKAEFHHIMGALVVEIDGKHAFIRHLNADKNGEFYDLDRLYTPEYSEPSDSISALVTGDEHVKFNLPSVRKATYDANDSIVKTLKPEHIIRHDVLDGYAGSHHHDHDDVLQFKKYHRGDHDYRVELDQVVKFLNETTPSNATNIIIFSNHNLHLTKWLQRVDPKKDPHNALLIHELKYLQYQNSLVDKTVDPLEIYITPKLKGKFKFIASVDRFILKGVDFGQHGDQGLNGARGSAAAFSKMATKSVIGHSHVARIIRGVYQVGTSTGKLEYEGALSERSNTHCIQYENGKRTLIDIIDGKWRL